MKWVLGLVVVLAACGKTVSKAGDPALTFGKDPGLVVAASDYTTGLLLGIRLSDRALFPEVPIHSDAVVRTAFGKRFVVNRQGQDNIQIVDSAGNTTSQFSTGRGTNPQDIAVLDDATAYVSRFRSKTLLKVRLPEGADLGDGVDFSDLADSDGYPEMTWMRKQGDYLFVVVQRIDTAHGYVPTDASYVAAVDLTTDKVAGRVKLNYSNPVTQLKADPEGSVYVGGAGKLGFGTFDGGIERLDVPVSASNPVIGEAELGGDILDFEILSAEKGLAVVAAGSTTRLVEFDPARGRFTKVWLQSTGYDLQEVLWDGATVWVAERSPSGPGLRNFTADGKQGTMIPLKLPPYHLELVR